ncbi:MULTISPECIES: DoxX family protein [Paenibacillus]|uniref:DoxX family protein n=1 Tax=Paenibacillus TaxID=44249 RepID=UPI0022B8D7A0|nr:DoxX family protein [Paenibacillus caseinilyticus]MCZ8521740.1 DoxX family protein [Paenibacillus caseinilyticus]
MNGKMKTIAYWVTTILGPASFVMGGYLHVIRDAQVMGALSHLGYPAYFATILGIGKLLGVVAVLVPGFPRVKEWAYAGFFILLTSAAASHAFAGDGPAQLAGPLIFLALVIASYLLRPDCRKLPSR